MKKIKKTVAKLPPKVTGKSTAKKVIAKLPKKGC
jgi:hypothetical protein